MQPLLIHVFDLKSGDAMALGALNTKDVAEEIEIESPGRSIEGELVEQIAMRPRVITVGHQVAGWPDSM